LPVQISSASCGSAKSARRERPRSRAAKKRHELAASHVLPQVEITPYHNDRFGSKADLTASKCDFRYIPNRRHRASGIAIEPRRARLLHGFVTSRYGSCDLLRHGHKRWHHKQIAHVLWQPRCLEVASQLHHVGVVDETRRTYRHHGRQRDTPRRIATFRHATLRVTTHRYATLEPLGKPGGSRAFSADDPPQAPVAPRSLPQPVGG
jgi:hypothetical protein